MFNACLANRYPKTKMIHVNKIFEKGNKGTKKQMLSKQMNPRDKITVTSINRLSNNLENRRLLPIEFIRLTIFNRWLPRLIFEVRRSMR